MTTRVCKASYIISQDSASEVTFTRTVQLVPNMRHLVAQDLLHVIVRPDYRTHHADLLDILADRLLHVVERKHSHDVLHASGERGV